MREKGLRSGRLVSVISIVVVSLVLAACGSSGLPVTIGPDAATDQAQVSGVQCVPSGGVVIFSGNVTIVNNEPQENAGLQGAVTDQQGTTIGSNYGPSIHMYEGVSAPFTFSVPVSGGSAAACSLSWG